MGDLPELQDSPEVSPDTKVARKAETPEYDVMRSSIVDSIHRSHVVRDISPKRVYASNKESHAALPDLFRQPKALQYLRPVRTQRHDDGGEGQRQPRLLQKLDHLLQEKLRMAESLAVPFSSPTAPTAQQGASNMRLDAYRQAFEAFIHSFTTYRPLLLRIKVQYDAALEDALESAHENVHMKSELAVIEQRRLRAVEEARVEASKTNSESRRELEHRLMEMEERAAAAEARTRSAEAEARAARAEEERALKELEAYIEQVGELRAEMISRTSWGKALAQKDNAHKAKLAAKAAAEFEAI